MMRSSMSMRNTSTVRLNWSVGRQTTPSVALTDSSSFSGSMPKARVTSLFCLAVSVSASTPVFGSMLVERWL
jgi:hypothetical protein